MTLQPLFFDTYEGDYSHLDLAKILADRLYYGVLIKATEGNYYAPAWFRNYWQPIKNIAGDRYGKTWFRGAYHYLKFNIDAKVQADFFLKLVDKAGGWDVGDFWPVVDAELGNDGAEGGHRDSNNDASAQQIIDCTSLWAQTVKQATGRQVMLYGNGAMRDKGITSRMECDWLWFPRYTTTLPEEKYLKEGWTLDRLVMWQFYGDGSEELKNYPKVSPMGRQGDISVMVMDGGIEKMRSLLFAENPNG